MRVEAIQGALVNLSMLIGLPVLRSRSADESARLIPYAARQWRRAANGALPRHGRRPTGKAALQSHLLQGLPGVGPERARRLLARFGSVAAVVAATRDELSEVHGIGPKVASKLRWAVEEPRATYAHVPQLSNVASSARVPAQGTLATANLHLPLHPRFAQDRVRGRH